MRLLVSIIRFIVGILFIISGFVKLNDPVGFSYKLQEYFSPAVLDLDFLSPYALGLAIIIVIVELVLGVALLIGYYKRGTLALLLLMILFFTFLTFYSAYYNKVTDCGCFGDALALTPWQSFTKDIVLLAMILLLLIGQVYIKPYFSKLGRTLILFFSFVACLGFGYYVLMHLPLIDFRAYHEGANIADGMQVPEDAPEALYEYRWKFNVNGNEEVITTNGDYPESKGDFLGVETTLIREGYIPPIHDFSIERDGTDYTEEFLNTDNLLMIVAYDISKTEWNGWPRVKKLSNEALRKGYTVIGLTASGEERQLNLINKQELNFEFYTADATTLKTIIRSNPGIVTLSRGTIIQKKHWNDTDEIILKNDLPTAKPNLDLGLKFKLDTIARLDSYYFKLAQASPSRRKALAGRWDIETGADDSSLSGEVSLLADANFDIVRDYMDKNGYPGIYTVGTSTYLIAFNIIENNLEQVPDLLPKLKKAGREGNLPFKLVAALEDRYLMRHSQPQRYGTQIVKYEENFEIWPVAEPALVNIRREIVGFEQDLQAYASELIGLDYKYVPGRVKIAAFN